MAGERWRLGHRPALDGLRGMAVLLVIVSHVTPTPYGIWGSAGVMIFFTLSGFLITALLLGERSHTGRISLRAFYVRRARRLLPALLAFLPVIATIWVLNDASIADAARAVGLAVAYSGNWAIAFFGPGVMGPMGHTWSLAIEEQFYLVWPLLLIASARTRRPRFWMTVACSTGILVAPVMRLLLWDGGAGNVRVYMGFDTRMDALLVGCLLAVWMTSRPADRPVEHSVVLSLLVDVALVVLAWWIVASSTFPSDYLLLTTWLPWATAALIVAVSHPAYAGVLRSRPMRLIGQRSYAMYLWHGIPVLFVLPHLGWLPHAAWLPVTLALTWLFATASWHLVERRVRRQGSAMTSMIAMPTSALPAYIVQVPFG